MPDVSSSVAAVSPLPQAVSQVNYAIFQTPTGTTPDQQAVPATYNLFVASVAPTETIGVAGDWYEWMDDASATTKVYQKTNSTTWTLVSTIGGGGSGSGDVSGPASSTDNGLVLFNGATGKLIKNAGLTIAASGVAATATEVPRGNDPRMTNSRNPNLHASTHQAGGSDPIALDALSTPSDNTNLNVSTLYHGLAPKLPGSNLLFLRGDGTWAAPSVGGVSWGAITGTLSSQTDLQTALDAKVSTSVTVNGHPLSSNVTVSASDITTGVLSSNNGGAGSANGILAANGAGTVAAISVGSTLSYSGGVLSRGALTGDVTASSGSSTTTLANTGVSAATYGSATKSAIITLDAKGRATAASEATIPGLLGTGGGKNARLVKASTANYDTKWSEQQTFSVKDYGAVGDGVTSDTAAFSTTQTAAAAVNGVILVPYGSYLIDSNLNITSPIKFEGGKLVVSNAVTVTFTGGIEAGLYQIFNAPYRASWATSPNTGAGRVRIGKNSYLVYPEWFGAVQGRGSGVNSSNAIQSCLDACDNFDSSSPYWPTVYFSATYRGGDIVVGSDGLGDNPKASIDSSSSASLESYGETNGFTLLGIKFSGMVLPSISNFTAGVGIRIFGGDTCDVSCPSVNYCNHLVQFYVDATTSPVRRVLQNYNFRAQYLSLAVTSAINFYSVGNGSTNMEYQGIDVAANFVNGCKRAVYFSGSGSGTLTGHYYADAIKVVFQGIEMQGVTSPIGFQNGIVDSVWVARSIFRVDTWFGGALSDPLAGPNNWAASTSYSTNNVIWGNPGTGYDSYRVTSSYTSSGSMATDIANGYLALTHPRYVAGNFDGCNFFLAWNDTISYASFVPTPQIGDGAAGNRYESASSLYRTATGLACFTTPNNRSSFNSGIPVTSNGFYAKMTLGANLANGSSTSFYAYHPYVDGANFGGDNLTSFRIFPASLQGCIIDGINSNAFVNANEIKIDIRNVSGATLASGTTMYAWIGVGQ